MVLYTAIGSCMFEEYVPLVVAPLNSAVGTKPARKLGFFAAVVALVLDQVVLVSVAPVAPQTLEPLALLGV